MSNKIESFDLPPGRKIGKRYTVVGLIGRGAEGEVYSVEERDTGIVRAAKIYYPHRDPHKRLSVYHARKLNKLRRCPIVLQYHHSEEVMIKRRPALAMISEFCEGIPLWHWVRGRRGGRLEVFTAMHVLHQIACGLEHVHGMGEYHSDVHSENILIRPQGIGFELKLIDFYEWGRPTRAKMQQDIVDSVRVFAEIVGGRDRYAKLPDEAKQICRGMQASRILERFPTIAALRLHLEVFESVTPGWQ
ncbi:MAG: protein kinase domain-containing protein [Planctomycetota bacterium]